MSMFYGGGFPLSPGKRGREDWEAKRPEREKQAGAEHERQEREQAAYVAELEAEIDAEDAAADAKPAPRDPVAELRESLERERANRAAWDRGDFPTLEAGAGIRAQDKRRRRAEREAQWREAAEREAGVPEAQAKWDAELDAIREARATAEREARERCQADEQAARDAEQVALDALSPRPTLESMESRRPVAA